MKAIQKTHEILLKPYSENVLGYVAHIDFSKHMSGHYIVINSNLSEALKEVVQSKLQELSENNPLDKFVLLHGNFQIYKSESLQLTEMGESA